jgi:pSer/pThr/pTyr-binding forkhead associated (FHA) protein
MTAIIFFILRILLSFCLYLIIFLFFYFLWKENKKLSSSISQRRIPALSLSLISDDIPFKTRIFHSQDITIGRSSNCDWQLPNDVVSNYHSRIKYHHKQWWIEDLKSKNGTLINGQKVVTPTVLTSGDEISIGNNQFQLSISDEVNTDNNKGNSFNRDKYG